MGERKIRKEIEKHKYIIVTPRRCTHYIISPLMPRILHHPRRHWTLFSRKLPLRIWTAASLKHLRPAGRFGYRSKCHRGTWLRAWGRLKSCDGRYSSWGRIQIQPCCTGRDRRWRWLDTGGKIECTCGCVLNKPPTKWKELLTNWIWIGIRCLHSQLGREVSPALRWSIVVDLTMVWFQLAFLIPFCTIFS